MKRILMFVLLGVVGLSVLGCGASESRAEVRHITPDEAWQLMQTEKNYIIVDVRTQKEFRAGHLPGAICIPNETIDKEPPKELTNKEKMLLVYCRSGRRSKEAAQKLAAMGYTNIVEFGGILDWHGEIVKD